jgi:hypothetical protein
LKSNQNKVLSSNQDFLKCSQIGRKLRDWHLIFRRPSCRHPCRGEGLEKPLKTNEKTDKKITSRLSERNCIELVTLLLEKGLLDVIFTIDGKEYLTPEQLRKEIEDELYVNGGRVNLVELSKILNVDFQKISIVADKIAEDSLDVSLILGEFVLGVLGIHKI